MIPWEVRTPIHSFYHKTVIFSLFLCLCILSSHCRPIYYNKGGDPVSGTHFTNNGSMVVRVIVSSSSSSSSSSSDAADTRFGEVLFPFSSFPTPTTSTTTTRSSINPTTYHPELTLPPISRSVRAKSTMSPHSFSSSDDNIFSVFYRAFTEQGDKGLPNLPGSGRDPRPNLQISFHPPRPKPENNVSVNNNDGRIVSVVSQSRSVSAAVKPPNGELLRLAPKSTPVPANVNSPQNQHEQPRAEALTQPATPYVTNVDWQGKVWGQPEQQWGESMKIREDHSEKVWGQPEKVWAEPERNWGEPEKVHWGDTLKVPAVKAWGKQEEEEEKAQNDQGTPRIYEIPPDDLDETQQGKFYELGEDEEAEPQELNLKESEVKAKVEEAQLASRSWELPELNTPVDHSLEMMSESVQVPQTHPNSANPNARPRSAAGDGKAIDTENQNPDDNAEAEGERPGKKFGYVLDSSDVRKYRVEERTPDGYIVGEYGVINHDNGFLRGVRYTADGTINPRLIHEALMKFLAL